MQKKIKLSTTTVFAIIVLLILIVLVRVFQEQLFYDPFLAFFKAESKELPLYDNLKLFGGIAFRYLLNSLFSLAIIYLVFKDRSILKLCSILYVLLFLIFITIFFIVLNTDEVNLLLLFYIRRFLIQPLFLILFLPAFYYQKRVQL
ncbi:exosortase F system-associated protein [Flavobacterium arcticum]|uniref:Exosortase F system-associated protein n=1 Tax=Flavobacterium arcticum TaxID=1784713 RepID=A0A345H9K3_9FLAO|nr:exosortase F system-associated protein [Flavobacterium arcticum]AXG73263.1 exosortase F system-associated protein [Flavobacterium arcticum]KAF2513059.1 exosortase F system-associated protein [Flavobacterium arcticum]